MDNGPGAETLETLLMNYRLALANRKSEKKFQKENAYMQQDKETKLATLLLQFQFSKAFNIILLL